MNFRTLLLLLLYINFHTYNLNAACYENRSSITKKPYFPKEQYATIIAASKPQATPLTIQTAAAIWENTPNYEFSPGKASELYQRIGFYEKAHQLRIKQAQRCIALLPDHNTRSNKHAWNLAHQNAIKWVSQVIAHEQDQAKKEHVSKLLKIFKTFLIP